MLEKTFDPTSIELRISQKWVSMGIGKPAAQKEAYCIMVPPPNVTGSLHLGHALQHAIMDTLSRHHRMKGYKVLLQTGTDHAGIATQMVVERQLKNIGIQKNDLKREDFIDKIWEWKKESGGNIKNQMMRMGISVDWETERFTLDEGFNHAVAHTFVTLYNEGYIYKGKRLVHWDTQLKTAISDLEVQSVSRQGLIWYIRYPLENGDHITIATTRPETMLGDAAICVHPDDERYQSLIGQNVTLPLTHRTIPIIADEACEPEFGTGCLKITPAHDFTDYDIGKRHNLEMINILTAKGTLNDNCPEDYQGLDRFEARKKIISDLKSLDLIEKTEPHTSILPIGDRSQTILEPYLTDQWYVKTDALAQAALDDFKAEKINFVPENYGKVYTSWLENIEDWCISRQLWWGHRIPAFYDENGQVYVGLDEDSVRKTHNIIGKLTQDEDVLDTWFSSALWPFATLGWPNNTERLQTFYPNSLLITGFDIIFFWVARMCMFGKHFTQKMPFPTVYVTGLIRDELGQKMSKSKGNVIDPIDLIEGANLDNLIAKRTQGMMLENIKASVIKATKKSFPQGIEAHGTDALRVTLLALSTHSKDINFDLNKLRAHRNFCNKIWNAFRFLSQSTATASVNNIFTQALEHQISLLLLETEKHLSDYRFDLYAKAIYDFFWHEFCNWHLELAKIDADDSSDAKMAHLYNEFDKILTILHPALPFITEALWLEKYPDHSITAQEIPTAETHPTSYNRFMAFKSLVSGIRQIRSELNISPKEKLALYYTQDKTQLLKNFEKEISQLAGIHSHQIVDSIPKNCCIFIDHGIEIGISLQDKIDPKAEKSRLEKKINKLNQQYEKLGKKVNNPMYQEKAPESLKISDSRIQMDLNIEIQRLETHLAIIQSL